MKNKYCTESKFPKKLPPRFVEVAAVLEKKQQIFKGLNFIIIIVIANILLLLMHLENPSSLPHFDLLLDRITIYYTIGMFLIMIIFFGKSIINEKNFENGSKGDDY